MNCKGKFSAFSYYKNSIIKIALTFAKGVFSKRVNITLSGRCDKIAAASASTARQVRERGVETGANTITWHIALRRVVPHRTAPHRRALNTLAHVTRPTSPSGALTSRAYHPN